MFYYGYKAIELFPIIHTKQSYRRVLMQTYSFNISQMYKHFDSVVITKIFGNVCHKGGFLTFKTGIPCGPAYQQVFSCKYV